MSGRPQPSFGALDALPVALGAMAGSALAALALPLAFDERTSIGLLQLLFPVLLALLTLLWVSLRGGRPVAELGLRPEGIGGHLAAGLGFGLLLYLATIAMSLLLTLVVMVLTGDPLTFPRQEVLPREPSTLHAVLTGIVVVVVAPIGEEIFFRGLLFGGLRRSFPFWPAALIGSTFFALAHFDVPLLMPMLFVVGLGLAYLYERRGSLIPSIAAHTLFNLIGYLFIVRELT